MSYTNVSYHTLDDPLNEKKLPGLYSDLHTLYPGRPMSSSDNNDRYSIDHEDPEEAHETFEDVKEKTRLYGERLENKARKAGSGDKMTIHAVEDPSTIIEDPVLMNTEMLNPKDTPLLKSDLPADTSDFSSPKRENFAPSPNGNTQTKSSGTSYKWIAILVILISMAVGYYYYSKSSNDIYEF